MRKSGTMTDLLGTPDARSSSVDAEAEEGD
jgi:hypothetical protein